MITARLRPNPVLSAGGDHLDILGTRFTQENAGGPSELNLRTDFTIERGGKRPARVEAARAAVSVAGQAFLDAARTLALDAQSAFVEAQLAGASLKLTRENRASFERMEEVNAARLAARQAQLRHRAALNRLAALLGRAKPSSLTEVRGDFRRDARAPSPAELRAQALERRPDLLALPCVYYLVERRRSG